MTDHSVSTDIEERLHEFAAYGASYKGRVLAQLALTEIERLRALTTASDAVTDERLDSVTIEACAKIAEGTAPIAAGNFFAARRDQCAIIATKIRALKIADERAKELATLRGEPVAWRWKYEGDTTWTVGRLQPYGGADVVQPLYAAPDWKQDHAETSQPVTKASHDVGTQEERT
jgi:hypothetical protein